MTAKGNDKQFSKHKHKLKLTEEELRKEFESTLKTH